jgi:hypothetical protein
MSVIKRKPLPAKTVAVLGRDFHYVLNWKNVGLNNTDVILDQRTINVHFGMGDEAFVKTFTSRSGFTERAIIHAVVDTGIAAGKFAAKHRPEMFRLVDKYKPSYQGFLLNALFSKQDVLIKGENVFVMLSS